MTFDEVRDVIGAFIERENSDRLLPLVRLTQFAGYDPELLDRPIFGRESRVYGSRCKPRVSVLSCPYVAASVRPSRTPYKAVLGGVKTQAQPV